MKPTRSPYLILRQSRVHHKGIFAKKFIPKGKELIEYVGRKISKKEGDRIADEHIENNKNDPTNGKVYVFELNKRYDLDGNVPWNTARFINHSCDPNCEVVDIKSHLWITAIRDIKKGEELYYNYGYDLEDYQDHPCRCGSEKCIGFILDEELWPKLKLIIAEKNAKKEL
ncbi:MAG: SET domain-containing protein-lysine N-methyltransferase [Nanoarchaeota archaeon]